MHLSFSYIYNGSVKKLILVIVSLLLSLLPLLTVFVNQTTAEDKCRIEFSSGSYPTPGQEITVTITAPDAEWAGDLTYGNLSVGSINAEVTGQNFDFRERKDHATVTIPSSFILPTQVEGGGYVTTELEIYAKVTYRGTKKITLGFYNPEKNTQCRSSIYIRPPDGYTGSAHPARPPSETDLQAKVFPVNPPELTDFVGDLITGYTQAVFIDISGLRANDSYKACLSTDFKSNCMDKNKFQVGSENDDILTDNTGYLDYFFDNFLCGDGKSTLRFSRNTGSSDKPLGDDCDPTRDYFHEGSTYILTIFHKLFDFEPVLSIPFYVRHSFPHVIFPVYELDDKGQRVKESTINLYDYYKASIVSNNGTTQIFGGETSVDLKRLSSKFELKTPVEAILQQFVKIRGGDRNNYKVSVNNVGGGHDLISDQCITVRPTNGQLGEIPISISSATSTTDTQLIKTLPPGNYTFSLQEQINEGDLDRGACIGGFEYYRFTFSVAPDGTVFLDGKDVKSDPNDTETFIGSEASDIGIPVCDFRDKETLDEYIKSGKCLKIRTALGSISTDPTKFIKDLFAWGLYIVSFVAVLYSIYAGYLLISSRGDKEKVAHAREVITSTIIGIIFIAFAFAILAIIGVDIIRIPGFSREL